MLLAGPDGTPRAALVYNGELYNDDELRETLAREGVRFVSRCDTETVLHALDRWGAAAIGGLRGMFALAWYDVDARELLLARDPLGIKPLYMQEAGGTLRFASEPSALLELADGPVEPDVAMLSAYLTTIRSVLGERTLYAGLRALPPGTLERWRCGGRPRCIAREVHWHGPAIQATLDAAGAAERTRAVVEDAARRHLAADVPVCLMLSGGLDSTILAAAVRRPGLRTYCAGAAGGADLEVARRVAGAFGTEHTEVAVERDDFLERWPAMVEASALPMSTPNEVAIAMVAERLRRDGCIVVISGEGADELFAGYEAPLDAAHRFVTGAIRAASATDFELATNAWVRPAVKAALLRPDVLTGIDGDAMLRAHVTGELAAAEAIGVVGVDGHLRLQRAVNLVGLLRRLDVATMRAGVEGRTPFADTAVATLAESLPLACKYAPPPAVDGGAGGVAVAVAPRTKLVLRRAFSDLVPADVLARPKASFPLPFEGWIAEAAARLRTSPFARSIFTRAAIELVAREPTRYWSLAWPMTNLAIWGDRRW